MKYKFRAECKTDAFKLIDLLTDVVEYNIEPLITELPDVEITVETKETTLDELRNTMQKITDGHVMVQTVMPVEKYTGERDYTI